MKLLFSIIAVLLLLISPYAYAKSGGYKQHMENTLKLEMQEIPHQNELVYIIKIKDIKTGKYLTENDLKTAHTKKLHLLVIDPSLTEYYHLHPTVIKDGEWAVDFIPISAGTYRIWADVTRRDTGKQEYVVTDIGTPDKERKINKLISLSSNSGEYKFDLILDGALKAGEATMAKIIVNKNDVPFSELEPVMGAFAHVVGFSEDYKTIMHIHPMGKEPENANDRGGPLLEFHIEPQKPGFVKIFAQFRIDGKDIFVPFGVMVK